MRFDCIWTRFLSHKLLMKEKDQLRRYFKNSYAFELRKIKILLNLSKKL